MSQWPNITSFLYFHHIYLYLFDFQCFQVRQKFKMTFSLDFKRNFILNFVIFMVVHKSMCMFFNDILKIILDN